MSEIIQSPAPSSNDQIQGSGNPVKDSRFEKIVSAGERVFAKFGIVKPGRGRPRKDGQPKKNDLVQPLADETAPQSAIAGVAAIAPVVAEIDAIRVKVFVAGCVGILKGAVGFCKKWVAKNAREARINPDFTAKAIADCSPDEAAFKRWGDSLEVCAKQYNWDFEHMPAVALATETAGMFAPFIALAKEFRQEIARQRAKDEAPKQPEATLPKA